MTNIILLNLGYFMVFLALAIREILWLRITITGGQSTLFTYSMLNGNYNTLGKLRKSKPTAMGKLDSILKLDMAGKLTR